MKKYYLHRQSSGPRLQYEKELNSEQHAVVMFPGGPMLVLAGAGTGKTRTVTYRVARLIETGVRPENILLLTFTNKAAKEMMRRVEFLIGRNTQGLRGGTFHHVANMLLRRHCMLIGYKEGFSILDREDAKDLFDICLGEVKQRETILPKGSVLCEIYGLMKNKEGVLNEIIPLRFPHFSAVIDEIERIIERYETKKLALNLMDFDDLLTNWKRLLTEHEDIRRHYSSQFMHILVDEYQDTTLAGADCRSAGRYKQKLMVVGEMPSRSIHSGADFEKHPEIFLSDILMRRSQFDDNYRSTPEILHLAIRASFRTSGVSQGTPGKQGLPALLVPLKDTFQQSDFAAQKILDMNAEGTTLNEIAVLYRSHYQSMELQMELQRRGIPFEVRSGLKFFEQAHIKDILSFLRVVINPYDELSWKRIVKPMPGINITAGRLWEAISSSESPLTQ
jgi:DNA helicase-2/ATP-dependent DNA helicase PcrA